MKIDPNLLKEITAKSLANKSTGIRNLINSIHKDPKLRDWVTLESLPLAPIPTKRGENWHLITLLTTRQNLNNNNTLFNSPWGLIEWLLPQGKVIQIQDFRENHRIDEFKKQHQQPIAITPVDTNVNLDSQSKTQRENALFQRLEELVSQPFDLKNLSPHYAGLLPREIYEYYWLLVPDSKTWLNPNVSAIDISDNNQEISITNQQVSLASNSEIEISEQNLPTITSDADISSYLKTWLYKLHNLADDYGLSAISKQLDIYENHLVKPGFRLAFVGEFSRGKSNLINCLLDNPILPTGSLPTTSTLTSIVADENDQMEVKFPNKKIEIRSLNEESWTDLLALDPTGNNQETLAEIRLKINNSWLEKLNAELIDTPGAGDLNSKRAALVFDLLNQCDATVLVISATTPLSLTEIAFLEQEIIGRHVPHILVVVSKLDTIKTEEKHLLFEDITNRLGKISSNIPILPLHPIDQTQSETDTKKAIQKHLEIMVDQSERKSWRSWQFRQHLLDCCQQMKSLAETTITTAKLDETAKQAEIKKAQELIKDTELIWQQLELDLEKKRLKTYRKLEVKIVEIKASLVDLLKFQLKKYSNPQSWWKEDLPFTLRKELMTFSRNVENYIIQNIAEDNLWLEKKVNEHFSQEIATIVPVWNHDRDLIPDLPDLSLADLQKYRLLTRLGSSAAIVGGYILGGPIGIIASTGIWIYGENMMNKTVEEQKKIIEQELDKKVDICFQQYCQKVFDRLRQIYQQLIQEIKQQEKIWQSNQQILVENLNSTNEIEKWTKLINQVDSLTEKITKTLEN